MSTICSTTEITWSRLITFLRAPRQLQDSSGFWLRIIIEPVTKSSRSEAVLRKSNRIRSKRKLHSRESKQGRSRRVEISSCLNSGRDRTRRRPGSKKKKWRGSCPWLNRVTWERSSKNLYRMLRGRFKKKKRRRSEMPSPQLHQFWIRRGLAKLWLVTLVQTRSRPKSWWTSKLQYVCPLIRSLTLQDSQGARWYRVKPKRIK